MSLRKHIWSHGATCLSGGKVGLIRCRQSRPLRLKGQSGHFRWHHRIGTPRQYPSTYWQQNYSRWDCPRRDKLEPAQKSSYCSHLQVTNISNVFGAVGSTECQLTIYGRFGGRGLEGHGDEIFFDCPLRKEAVRDSRDGTRIVRIQGAECQVIGANTTERAVDANAETDGCLCSPQDPVNTGGYTRDIDCNTYGLFRYSNTWGDRHCVVVQTTWDRRLDTANK